MTQNGTVHLWEVNHQYYCHEGNYFSNECSSHYRSWADFISEEGDADLDMNLVFRWDWEAPHEGGYPEKPIIWVGDENYRDCILKLFYMGQRKGLYRYVTVDVCRADEPQVRAWLQIRFEHLMSLWSPFK